MLSLRSVLSVGVTNKYKFDHDQDNKRFHLKPVTNSVAYAHKHLNFQFRRARRSRCQSRLPRQLQANAPVRARKDDDQISVQPEAMTSELGKEGPTVLQAQLCLCGVAVLWGTYSPVVRYIYACDGPPSPAALTAVRTVIQAFVLLASNVFIARQRLNSVATPTQRARSLRKSDSPNPNRNASGWPRPIRTISTKLHKALNSTTDVLWIAGIELGLWNFCGSTFQALGLQYTSATRGAFLIQATSLLTPVMATVAGDKPSKAVWLGCCFTLCGTLLITQDHTAPALSDPGSATLSIGGDSLILAAAFFYSLVTIRLGRNAQRFQAVPLAASKSLAIALIAVAWLPCTVLLDTLTRGEAVPLWPGWQNPMAWLAVVWSALGPGALVAYLQSQGQATVPAAQSQVIYSSVPVWSALLAFVFMPEETMGLTGYFGGAVIVLAGLLAIK